MAFNITSWSKTGRDHGRGAPPPRGSIEYVCVGGPMWDPVPPTSRAPRSQSGLHVYELGYGDLDAGKRWVESIDRAVRQARAVHKDKILSGADERSWDEFMSRWRPLVHDVESVPGRPTAMFSETKRKFDALMNESRKLHQAFAKKGMSPVPVPYAGELLLLLRQMPRRLRPSEMSSKLRAGIKCGEKMLDANTPWYHWVISPALTVATEAAEADRRPLERAIDEARTAADIYARSERSQETFSPGDPVYDEFLRRLTRIWVEAAGLYGIRETKATAAAELRDEVRKMPESAGHLTLGLLAAAGVAYLGIAWLARPRAPQTIVVGVPDAIPRNEP